MEPRNYTKYKHVKGYGYIPYGKERAAELGHSYYLAERQCYKDQHSPMINVHNNRCEFCDRYENMLPTKNITVRIGFNLYYGYKEIEREFGIANWNINRLLKDPKYPDWEMIDDGENA